MKKLKVGDEVFHDKKRFFNNVVKPMSNQDKEKFQKKLQEEYGVLIEENSK